MMTMADSPLDDKSKLWKVDPALFQPPPRPRRIVLLMDRLRPLGSLLLVCLAAFYPVLVVYLGIEYGGVVFWGSLAASLVIIYMIISGLGYAGNFEGRGQPILRGLFAITLGFGLAVGLYLSILNLKIMTIPIVIGLGVLGLAYYLRK